MPSTGTLVDVCEDLLSQVDVLACVKPSADVDNLVSNALATSG